MSIIHYDPRAMEKAQFKSWRELAREVEPKKPTLANKVWASLMYGTVVAVVGWAFFYITPAHAAGSMAQDVRVVTASSSFVYFGDTREGRKAKADIARDNNKAQRNIELENLKFEHSRQLLNDKAYYERLKDQRKGKCTYC